LFNILQSKNVDILFCSQEILDFKNQLSQERENVDTIWALFTQNSNELSLSKRRTEIDKKDYYRHLYFEIIDNIQTQINIRFKSFEKLQYFDLPNPTKLNVLQKKIIFHLIYLKIYKTFMWIFLILGNCKMNFMYATP